MSRFPNLKRSLANAAIGLAALSTPAFAKDLSVVVTIKPIHALAAAVMEGVGTPRLLIDGASSPHTFSLKPSDAQAINTADMFVRVSESLEPFTGRLVKALPKKVQIVTLEAAPGLTLHALRAGGNFEAHDHGKKGGHAHSHGHAHGSTQSGQAKASAQKQDMDGHIWLDPANAKLIASHLAEQLGKLQPANTTRFKANADALGKRLDALDAELQAVLKPFAGRPYLVFHDAYQYLERRYGLEPVGAVTVSPDVPASAKRLIELRRKITDLKASCVFSEPQFTPKVIDTIVEGLPARRGVLDPLGASTAPGPEHYFTTLRELAAAMKGCLD